MMERDSSAPFKLALITDASEPVQVIPLNEQSVRAALLEASYVIVMREEEMVEEEPDVGLTVTDVSEKSPPVTEKRGRVRVESAVNVREMMDVLVEILSKATAVSDVTAETGLVTAPPPPDGIVRVYSPAVNSIIFVSGA